MCIHTCMHTQTHTFSIMLGLIIKVLSSLFYLSTYSSNWLLGFKFFAPWCIKIRKMLCFYALINALFFIFAHFSNTAIPKTRFWGQLGKCDFVFSITVRIKYAIRTNFFFKGYCVLLQKSEYLHFLLFFFIYFTF